MKLHDWRVLTHSECSLCDAMLQALCDLLGDAAAAQIAVQDIAGNPELENKYGQRLPVLMIDGEVVCCYRLDEARVSAHLPTA
jgi:hypothetical protein